MEPEQPNQDPDPERRFLTVSTVSNRSPRLLAIAAAAVILVAIGAGMLYLAYRSRSESPVAVTPSPAAGAGVLSSPSPQAAAPSPSPLVMATQAPPLAAVPFPSPTIAYPADWPSELRFPESFVLVEATSGTLPDGSTKGWSAKLRFKGSPNQAVEALTLFLGNGGWQIRQLPLDSGGSLLLVQRQGKSGNGTVIIDPDPSDSTSSRILAGIRL